MARDEDRDAPALAPPANLPVHLKLLGDLPRKLLREALAAARPLDSCSRNSSVRRKNLPPIASEEYWWEETMFAPRSNRNVETAATIPGRSAQPISSRAV